MAECDPTSIALPDSLMDSSETDPVGSPKKTPNPDAVSDSIVSPMEISLPDAISDSEMTPKHDATSDGFENRENTPQSDAKSDTVDSREKTPLSETSDNPSEKLQDSVNSSSRETTPDDDNNPLTRTESTQSGMSQMTSSITELSSLFTAVTQFNTKAVEDALKNGADIHEQVEKERNALHELVLTYCKLDPLEQIEFKHGVLDILQILVNNGIDVNDGDVKKQTALHVVASYGDGSELIKALLATGAKVNQADGQMRTALHYAVEKRLEANAKTLVEGGANPNNQDMKKQTPLHIASKGRNNLSLVEFLLRCGAEATIGDVSQRTPLHIAAKAGRADLVKEMLTFGAEVNIPDSAGLTAVHMATIYDITGSTLRELMNSPTLDINMQDAVSGDTPLHKAVSRNNHENIKLLAKAKANPNLQDILGETPLHRAYRVKEVSVWTMLMSMGGDVGVINHNGLSPLDKTSRAKNDVAKTIMGMYGKDE